MIAESQDEILEWDINKLWNAVNLIENKEEYMERICKVKYGVKWKFPIWYYLKEWYEVYPSSARVKVMGYGKYKLWDFMDEKDEREEIMRGILLEEWEDDSPTEARIK